MADSDGCALNRLSKKIIHNGITTYLEKKWTLHYKKQKALRNRNGRETSKTDIK
jgi:hypothetical protein